MNNVYIPDYEKKKQNIIFSQKSKAITQKPFSMTDKATIDFQNKNSFRQVSIMALMIHNKLQYETLFPTALITLLVEMAHVYFA